MNYIIINKDKFIVGAGSGIEADIDKVIVPPGHQLVKNHIAGLGATKLKFVNGAVVDTGESIFPVTVSHLRKNAYPEIGDQLDAMWKYLKANGAESDPTTAAMLDNIAAVKSKYPKS